MIISSNLKWNTHVSEIVKKSSKKLYFLTLLKRLGLQPNELMLFFVTCIRSLIDYACLVYHDSLPRFLLDDLEQIQKRAMQTVFPSLSYQKPLLEAGLPRLLTHRQQLTDKLFNQIKNDELT